MKTGYVRVSKQEYHEAGQIDALKEAGCENTEDQWERGAGSTDVC